jgi:hypothetical protein
VAKGCSPKRVSSRAAQSKSLQAETLTRSECLEQTVSQILISEGSVQIGASPPQLEESFELPTTFSEGHFRLGPSLSSAVQGQWIISTIHGFQGSHRAALLTEGVNTLNGLSDGIGAWEVFGSASPPPGIRRAPQANLVFVLQPRQSGEVPM